MRLASSRLSCRRGREAGFTLVELLLVIVVLGVLAGIVLFGVSRFRSDANAAACRADVAAVNAAAEAYQAVTGNYPREMADLTVGQYLMSAPTSGTYTFDATDRTATRSPACADLTSTAAATVEPSRAASTTAAPTTAATTTAATTTAATTTAATTTAATTTAAGTVTVPTTAAPATTGAGTACAGAVSIDNSWPQGYQAAITVTNRGTTSLTNWFATWTIPSGVTLSNGWNATVTQSGTTMRAQAPDWSTTLAPGASWAIGFIALGPSSPPPSTVTLNGASCS